jgi:hypothetical protein
MVSAIDILREDPAHTFQRLRIKLHTERIRLMYPFREFGNGNSIDYRCEIRRSSAHRVIIKDNVFLGPHTWLNVIPWQTEPPKDPAIVLRSKCAIGRQSIIAAKNYIEIGEDVLFAPSVFSRLPCTSPTTHMNIPMLMSRFATKGCQREGEFASKRDAG